MDGQTDVGQINLIGGLVTRNQNVAMVSPLSHIHHFGFDWILLPLTGKNYKRSMSELFGQD